MHADERLAEGERIALRMGFHPAFARAAAAQGVAAELARARPSSARVPDAGRPPRRPAGTRTWAGRWIRALRPRRSAPVECPP